MPTCRETEEINAAILMTIDCASFFVGFSANEQRHEKRCQKTVSLFKIRGVPRVCHFRRPYHVPHTKIARNVALVSKRWDLSVVRALCEREMLQRSGRRQGFECCVV